MSKNLFHLVSPKITTAMTMALLWAAGALTAEAQPYPAAVLADHPIAYWKLQETSGTTAYDSSAGGTNIGSYTNALLGQEGYAVGLAAEFNYTPATDTNASAGFGNLAGSSTDSYVSGMPLDEATPANAEFSVEAWVNGSSQSGGAGIVGKGWGGGGEEYFIDCGAGSGAFRFFIRDAAGTAVDANSTFYPDGNWHHLVGVCNETNGYIYFYIDSLLVASNTASGGINATTNAYMTIGARQSAQNGDYNDQFNGEIGQVAVYPYALSAAQVQNHYLAAGLPPTFPMQPTNYASVNEGATLVIPATAFGTSPLSYQWFANNVPISGQTNATLDLTNVSASLGGADLVLGVTNLYGSNYTSGTLLNVVSGAPEIITDVQPLQLVLYQGRPWTYSVVAGGSTPLYYQWLQNGTNISGATNSSYTINALPGTNTYFVNVSNSVNGGSVQPSSTATLVGVPAPTDPYPATIVAANPIAYWRLDEPDNGSGNTGSTANDYMGGHDGTYNQVLLGVPGYSPFDQDTAADFGTNANPSYFSGSYMQEVNNSSQGIPTIDSYLQASSVELSVECWVNAQPGGNSSSGSTIISLGNAGTEAFFIDASAPGSKFRFAFRESSDTAGYIYSSIGPDGNWHQLVAVVDEANTGAAAFYVDGNLAGTLGSLGGKGLYTASAPLSLGSDTTYQFNGVIDEVSIYTNAMSLSELLAHYAAAPLPPAFTAVPPATVAGYLGENATLSASVLGSVPMTNTWYSNNVVLAGQTNLYLTLNSLTSGTNTYKLKVSNAYGSTNTAGTVVSVPAGSGPPTLLVDVSPLTNWIYATEPISYSVTVAGSTPLHYQWYFDAQPLSAATASSYSIASLAASNAGSYYCVISNAIGNITSSTAVLNVVPAPTNPYSLAVLAAKPLSYWRLDETNGATIGYDYVGGNNGIYSNTAGITHTNGIFGTNYDSDTAAYFNAPFTNYTRTDSTTSNYLGSTMTNFNFAQPSGANGEFTVEAWALGYTTTNQMSGGGIVSKGIGNGAEQFNIDAHTGFRFYCRNAAGTVTATAQAAPTLGGSATGWKMDGNWHYLVGVCDQANNNLLLYVDGTLIGYPIITNGLVPPFAYIYQTNHTGSTGTNGVILAGTGIVANTNLETAANIPYDANSISIGSRNQGSGNTGIGLSFAGAVDEVAIYNYPFTPLEVSNHYAVAKNMAVTLYAQNTNGQTVLSWTSAWNATQTLQSATNLLGPWTPIPGVSSPYTVTNSGPAMFYRLQLY